MDRHSGPWIMDHAAWILDPGAWTLVPWIMDPGALDHGSWCRAAALVPWIMDHTAWILVPGSSWSCCNDHLEPWIMDHGSIPWVLVALDPGAQNQGSWTMNHEPQHMVLDQLPLTTTCCVLVYSQE